MRIAIQQPEHLPWIGFFDKMIDVDLYVYLDNVQYKKRYFENRNRIRTATGQQWITVPVLTKGLYKQLILEVQIDCARNWKKAYLGSLQQNYSNTKYYKTIFHEIERIVASADGLLVDLNISLIEAIKKYLDIRTPTAQASELNNFTSHGGDLILDICLKAGADCYYSGPDGRNYLPSERFLEAGIQIQYHDYEHPRYTQVHQPFISHMSILDLLFLYGPEAKNILTGSAGNLKT
jgi:WbqC-like protein family